MEKSEIIILQSAYNKTPGQKYYIQPCKDPATGEYPSCVREVLDERTHQMILSETDKEDMKRRLREAKEFFQFMKKRK